MKEPFPAEGGVLIYGAHLREVYGPPEDASRFELVRLTEAGFDPEKAL